MRRLNKIFAVGLILIVYSNSYAEEVNSNYDYFTQITPDQEEKLGIITPPESAALVTTYKGIKIYDVEDRRYADKEIQQIKQLLDSVPKKMLATPPKAIIAASKTTRARIYRPNMVASASGPYLFLGDKFFIGGFRSKNTINDRLQIFMHEYAHVIQHYHLETERGSQSTMKDRSTLVFDFATKMGWKVKKGFGDKKKILEGDQIPFNPKYTNSWFLPEQNESDTSDYGSTNSVEDLAESFGWVIAGHPSKISQSRVDYVLNYLDEPIDKFTKGKIPLHNKFQRARSKARGLGRFFDERTPNDAAEVNYYYIDKKEPMPFSAITDFISSEFSARGFTEVEKMKHEVLPKNKEDYAHAIYEYEGEKIQIQIVDFTNAINYTLKGDTTIEIARF